MKRFSIKSIHTIVAAASLLALAACDKQKAARTNTVDLGQLESQISAASKTYPDKRLQELVKAYGELTPADMNIALVMGAYVQAYNSHPDPNQNGYLGEIKAVQNILAVAEPSYILLTERTAIKYNLSHFQILDPNEALNDELRKVLDTKVFVGVKAEDAKKAFEKAQLKPEEIIKIAEEVAHVAIELPNMSADDKGYPLTILLAKVPGLLPAGTTLPPAPYYSLISLDGLLNGLDPHSGVVPKDFLDKLRNPDEKFSGVGLEITVGKKNGRDAVLVTSVIEGGGAEAAGIKEDDLIVGIDKEVVDFTQRDLSAHTDLIRGLEGSDVLLTVLRGDKELKFNVKRRALVVSEVSHKSTAKYEQFKIKSFGGTTPGKLKNAFKKYVTNNNTLVLDLRGNPGGSLEAVVDALRLFIEPKEGSPFLYVLQRMSGVVQFGEDLYIGDEAFEAPRIDNDVIVLVDQGSASASEIMAANMKDFNRALIIGETTFGKGSVQSIMPLEKWAFKSTTALYFTGSNFTPQFEGVQPHVKIARKQRKDTDEAPIEFGERSILGTIKPQKGRAAINASPSAQVLAASKCVEDQRSQIEESYKQIAEKEGSEPDQQLLTVDVALRCIEDVGGLKPKAKAPQTVSSLNF